MEKEERGRKLDSKRRAQERTKAATRRPDTLANNRSGTKGGEIAAMGLFIDMQLQLQFQLQTVEPSEVATGEKRATDTHTVLSSFRSTRMQRVKD